ncbi:inactive TPR repeat-containing thioredoxin TTL3 [Vigna unguiculata]|uniref:inactive TPR repeat-containing thioredoxin TTL3 n=1 Tax=Vigna unguiculata TaxID=3917 RepID=UPI001016EF72|nr:inactive TPR repeat-containing thioredoxin TTL3 [Vigna unguiculata]
MGNNSQSKCGCGGMIFWRSASKDNNADNFGKASKTSDTKKQQGGREGVTLIETASSDKHADSSSGSNTKPVPLVNQTRQRNHPKALQTQGYVNNGRRVPKEAEGNVNNGRRVPKEAEGYVNNGRRVPKDAVGISGELESMFSDRQKGSSTLVRASSSNVMMFSNLGNLRKGGNTNTNSQNVVDYRAKQSDESPVSNGRYTNQRVENASKGSTEKTGSLCRAVSTRMDPEQLKIMGNEDYKNGRFEEALALYEAAISIDPNKASYRSNKSAALTALGRLLEAVFECREAIQIEPHYQRAHQRLGSLNKRLGETDNALYHYKLAGSEADPEEMAKVKKIQFHLNKCTEARRIGDWNNLIKEASYAISSGADSAPQIFALQAEAFLKLRRHQHAEEALLKGPNFDVEQCTRFFGQICNANLLVIRARVYLAVGRFDDALVAINQACKLDSNNKDAIKVMTKTKAVASARSNGNELFKASNFSEACAAYEEGLENDPYNSVLLCNRAACRSKLGQFEKAVEDCNAALNLRPSYSRARLRRADCNAKLKRWEASIQDYEILVKETPEDEGIKRSLMEAKEHLLQQRSE